MLYFLQKNFANLFLTAFLLLPVLSPKAFAQTAISPTTWGGTNSTTASGPSNFAPLPASTAPVSAAVNVSQWNRVGVNYNTGANRYNSTGWTLGTSSVTTEYISGKYLTFTVTNNTTTEIQITGVNIGTGQMSTTGPTTFGLGYTIGSGSLVVFCASAAGPSPTFTGTTFALCAGQTATFYMCGWGGTNTAGTWSINTNAAITASYATAVTASAGSNSPVTAGNPLNLTTTVSNGISPYTYSWSGPLSFSSTSSAPSVSSPGVGASGTYSLVVTDNWGCTASATTAVTVNPSAPCSGTPTAGTATPLTANFCNSGSTTLNLIGGSPSSGLAYQWSSSTTNTPPGTVITGATSTAYTISPAITATTFFWCTTTCTVSASSNISTSGTVTVNPTPTVTVTPTGGNYCSGTSGLSMTAGGANTYIWSPSTALSAITGASVTAAPITATTYTITGTDINNCVATNTVLVNYTLTPGPLSISPTSVTACAGSGTNLLTATGGTVGPTTVSSGTISVSIANPNEVATVPLTVAGIPVGATITGAYVTLNFTSNYLNDYIFNLVAPNGSILNLINLEGPHGNGSFTNTVLSSAGGTTLSAGATPFTGTYAADATLPAGPIAYTSTVSAWTSLYSIPNGVWTLVGYNNSTFTNTATITSFAITLVYSYQAPVTWASTTNLFTNAGGTTSYTGTATNTVYENPLTAGVITYTATATNSGCASTATVTTIVKAQPTAITGNTFVCAGATTTLSDAISGGNWSSSNSAVATIDPVIGAVSGLTFGMAAISYTNGCGSGVTTTVTVNTATGPISGASSVCPGSGITLSDPGAGGTWSSSSASVATVSTGGVVTGGIAGMATITYSTGCGTAATLTITVTAIAGPISGASSVCSGSGITLSDPVTGGTWSSGNTFVATIDATGDVTGIAAGTSIVSYIITNTCGATSAATTLTVNPLPLTPAAITGTTIVCVGNITVLSDVIAGGVWSSNNTSVATTGATGSTSGMSIGSSIISYTISNSCGSATATVPLTVSLPPVVTAITGNTVVCGITVLSDATSGGVWSSGNPSVATIDATGTVYGISIATTTISYTIINSCGSAYTTTTVTINPLPSLSAITGPSTVCVGGTMTLNDAAPGGIWGSSNLSVATVGATGTVTGVAIGSATISYTITNSCGSSFTDATVTAILLPPPPTPIAGSSEVCAGSTITLSDSTTGGVWTSSALSIATINSMGVVTGITGGSTIISYSITNSCGVLSATLPVTISTLPVTGIITGSDSVCPGHTTTLADITSGGVWSSNVPFYATVSSSGVVTGVNQGLDNISYTVTNICGISIAEVEVVIFPALSTFCNPTGVNMVNSAVTELKVFPNPNPGTFTMEVLSPATDGQVNVIITNVAGEKVKEFMTITNKENNIKLDEAAGIYFLSANTVYGTNVVKLIITN